MHLHSGFLFFDEDKNDANCLASENRRDSQPRIVCGPEINEFCNSQSQWDSSFTNDKLMFSCKKSYWVMSLLIAAKSRKSTFLRAGSADCEYRFLAGD